VAEPRGCSGLGIGYGPELLDELASLKVAQLEKCARPSGS
jgi:hypothetical protein